MQSVAADNNIMTIDKRAPIGTGSRKKSALEKDFQKRQGALLRKLRESGRQDLSELVFSLRCSYPEVTGFNTTTMTAMERGERAVHPYRIELFAEYFDSPLTYLYGEDIMRRELLLLQDRLNIRTPHALGEIPANARITVVPLKTDGLAAGYYLLSERATHPEKLPDPNWSELIHLAQDNNDWIVTDKASSETIKKESVLKYMKNYRTVLKVKGYTVTL